MTPFEYVLFGVALVIVFGYLVSVALAHLEALDIR